MNKSQLGVILGTLALCVLLFLAPRTPSSFQSDEERVQHVIDLVNTGQVRAPMQAILLLREYADEHPDNMALQMQLGHFAMQTNQFEKAVERYSAVKQMDVADTTGIDEYLASAKMALAVSYLESGEEIMKGAELLGNVLQEYPDNAEVHYYLGQLYLQLEEYQEALHYLNKVRELDVSNRFPQVLFTIAETHALLGDYEMAVFYMESFRGKILADPNLVAGVDRMIEEYKMHLK